MSAFEEKRKIEQTETASASPAQGRPGHNVWHGFTRIKQKGNSAAKCLNCGKLLKNTGKARLATHRFVINYMFLCDFFISFCPVLFRKICVSKSIEDDRRFDRYE